MLQCITLSVYKVFYFYFIKYITLYHNRSLKLRRINCHVWAVVKVISYSISIEYYSLENVFIHFTAEN